MNAMTVRRAEAGATGQWASTRIKAARRIAAGINVPRLKASTVAIIGPLVGEDVPPRDACKWIEGDAPGRYCAQPAEGGWCAHHFARVRAPKSSKAGAV